MKTDKQKVVVIGAGTSGLAAIHTLLKQSDRVDVTVLEGADHPGGRMAGEEVDGFYVDRAASLFIESYATVRSIGKDLGISFERSPYTKGGYVYSNGKFCGVFVGGTLKQRLKTALTLLSFRLLSPKAVLQFARFSRIAKSKKEFLDVEDQTKLLPLDSTENFKEYMERNSLEEYLNQWVESDIRAFTGGAPEQFGTAACMAMLWNFVLNPDENLSVPTTGVGSLATALGRTYYENIRFSTPAKRVVIEDGAVKGVITEAGDLIEADSVICTTTATVALQLIPDLPSDTKDVLAKVKYSACCKLVIGLDFDLLPEGAYAVTFPRGSGTPLVAVENAKMVAPDAVPEGKTMYNCVVMEDDAREIFPLSDSEIADRLIGEIRKFFPEMPQKPEFIRVYRWHEASCLTHQGLLTEAHEMRQNSLRNVKGLYLAGDYFHLPLTNGAMRNGVNAARDCLDFVSGSAVESLSS